MTANSFFKQRNIVALLILAGAIFIGIRLGMGIYDKSTEAERKAAHADQIKSKLLFLRDLQLAYHSNHDEYAASWDEMKSFLTNEKFHITERTEIVDTIDYGTHVEDTITLKIDTVSIVSVYDSLISKGKYAKLELNDLFRIPDSKLNFGVNAKNFAEFDVFEIKDIDPKTPKIDRGHEGMIPYQVGSMNKPTTKGNWEN